MRSSSSGVIVTSTEAMSVLSCSIAVAPMIVEVRNGAAFTKAIAIWAGRGRTRGRAPRIARIAGSRAGVS
jgi:hypothetical protein